jgi:hypothetical protein
VVAVCEGDKVLENFRDQLWVLLEELVVSNTDLHVLELDGRMGVVC